MPISKRARSLFVATAVTAFAGGLAATLAAPPAHAETAVAPEMNPAGDIPDSQVFIDYVGQGFSLKVPEGWARSGNAADVRFVDKLDGIAVDVEPMVERPTVDWTAKTYIKKLADIGRAVSDVAVNAITRPAGDAIQVRYMANSDPNPVTSKQVRLEAQQYLFWKDGKFVTLTLWAPAGADNVDQWLLMSESFRWQ